jgi:serine/threonine protein kinase KIN1/2
VHEMPSIKFSVQLVGFINSNYFYINLHYDKRIEYTHKSHIIHRDIKLENIRINPSTGVVKVLDFGFATFYSPKFTQHSSCGSPCYAAPEIYSHKPYKGPEVDIWSLGVCLYGMVVGGLPFDHTSFQELSKSIRSGKLEYPEFLSKGGSLNHLIT